MKSQRVILLVLVLIVPLLVMIGTGVQQHEPTIKGQPLTHWLLTWGQSEEWPQGMPSALVGMDDRCMTFLIRQLEWTPSPMVAKLNWLVSRVTDVEPFHDRPDYRAVAATALANLGSRATPAIPALEDMAGNYRGEDPEAGTRARGSAIAALIRIRHESVEPCAEKSLDYFDPVSFDYSSAIYFLGTNAAPAVPLFVKTLETATNDGVVCAAAWGLSSIHSRPGLAVPALASLLTHTNRQYRAVAAMCLESFGADAQPARGDLIRCLNDPDEIVRWAASNTLRKIDPESARELDLQ